MIERHPLKKYLSPEEVAEMATFLISDKSRTQNIRNKLATKKKLICGISWKSSSDQIGSNKSIELSNLKELLQIPNILFVNIQYEANTLEVINFCNQFNLKILLMHRFYLLKMIL